MEGWWFYGIIISHFGFYFSCCPNRLRRLGTGQRNTDITNAHGLVFHGYWPVLNWDLCACGADFKGFGEQARLVALCHLHSHRIRLSLLGEAGRFSVQNPLKSAPQAHKIQNLGLRNPWMTNPCALVISVFLRPCSVAVGSEHKARGKI